MILSQNELNSCVSGKWGNPHDFLGLHSLGANKGFVARAIDPLAEEVFIINKETQDAYLLLKDALVGSDVAAAEAAAQEMRQALSKVDMALLKGDAHLYWMEQLKALQAHSEKITTTTDLEAQRKQFDFLSQALILTVKVFGTDTDTLYVQHCPMAFDDNGADWLSAEDKVLNPYFGEAMLRCGIIEETIVSSETN